MAQKVSSQNQLYKGLIIGFTLVLMLVGGVLGRELVRRNQALRQKAAEGETCRAVDNYGVTRYGTCCRQTKCYKNGQPARLPGDDTKSNGCESVYPGEGIWCCSSCPADDW